MKEQKRINNDPLIMVRYVCQKDFFSSILDSAEERLG